MRDKNVIWDLNPDHHYISINSNNIEEKKEDTWVVTINISQGRQIQHNDNQSSTPQLILAQDQNKVEQTPHLFMLTMHVGLETPCLLQP